MRITEIKTFVVYAYRTNFVFVRVDTDEGLSGVGEGTLEYKEHALLGAIEDIRRTLVGRDPGRIEELTGLLYRDSYWRTGPVLQSAVSAIEMALWDIKGKYYGAPVYDLLGGKVREEIRMYANGWFAGARTPEEFAQKAEEAVALGVTALKWDPFGKAYMTLGREEFTRALACVEAVHGAVKGRADLLIEGHGRFDVATSIRIARALAPFEPMFFEEPVPPDSMDALTQVHEKSPVPIAAGERLFTLYDFARLLERGCVDFVQPDMSHCGGISAVAKIAAMAQARYISLAPHNPSGPVANAAALQLAGCLSGFRILEIMLTDVAWRRELTDETVTFREGAVAIPDRPGLGVELREANFSRYPFQPIDLRHYKGSLTDIRPKEGTCLYMEGMGAE